MGRDKRSGERLISEVLQRRHRKNNRPLRNPYPEYLQKHSKEGGVALAALPSLHRKKIMKERMVYAARIYKDEYGYEVEFPQLELATAGSDMDDALYMASDALETYFFDYKHDNELPPKRDLDIELRPGDTLAVISVFVEPEFDYELTTREVMELLNVNQQRVAQLREQGRIAARKIGRDYLHSRSDVEELRRSTRKAGRPRKELVTA